MNNSISRCVIKHIHPKVLLNELFFGKQCLPDQKGSKQKDSARRRNFLFLLVGGNPQTPMIEDFIFGGAPDGAYFSSCWCSR